jgi:cation diffusion facilitator family transporter
LLEAIFKDNKKVIGFSLFVSLLVMGLKLWAYLVTRSNAVLTDAAESLVNIVAAAFGMYSIYLSSRPLDKNHLYGHGKIEFFSSGIEGLLIMMAGIATLIPAVFALFSDQKQIHNSELGILLTTVIIIINGGAGWLIFEAGRRNNSIVLRADGKHLMIDSISSFISGMALIIVWFSNNTIWDLIIAIGLAAYIIFNGYKLVRESVAGLMDETDPALFDTFLKIINTQRKPIWIDVHNFKIMRYGTDIHIDCHLTLPYYLTLEKAHDEVRAFEDLVKEEYGRKVDFFIHTDPCLEQCCTYCNLSECTFRKHDFTGQKIWDADRLIYNHKHFIEN